MRRFNEIEFRIGRHVERDANWPPRGQKWSHAGTGLPGREKTIDAIVDEADADGKVHCAFDEKEGKN